MKKEWAKPEMESLEISQTACTGGDGGKYGTNNPFDSGLHHDGYKNHGNHGKYDGCTGEDMTFSE